MVILDGKKTADKRNEELAEIIKYKTFYEGVRPPKLVILSVGDDPASASYIKGKIKACKGVGVECEHVRIDLGLDFDIDKVLKELKIEEYIRRYNEDDSVDGIILQLPLPKGLDEKKLTNMISADKDPDGFHVLNKGLLMNGEEGIRPATPQGIMNLLDEYDLGDLTGKKVVVVGRSNIVGVPIAKMMLDRHATVVVCHSKTKGLFEECARADVIIAAVGKVGLITSGMAKHGAIVIDVGINRVVDEVYGKSKLVGDVDYTGILGARSMGYITPVPGGVGPMTVNALLENTVKLWLSKI